MTLFAKHIGLLWTVIAQPGARVCDRIVNSHSRQAKFALFAVVSVVTLLTGETQAATLTWNCANDNWANTVCWNSNSVPTGSDTVYIPAVSGSDTFITVDNTTGTALVGTMYIDTSTSVAVTLQQSAGDLRAAWQYIGNYGNGAITQSGGTNTVNYLVIGSNSGSSGTYSLSNTGSLTANVGGEYIGWAGTGSFIQNGGTNTVNGNLFLGYGSSGAGTYNLIAGSLTTDFGEYIGYYGTGIVTQTGGTHTITGAANQLILGFNSNSTGIYNQNGGTNSVPYLFLGFNDGSNGTYSLTAGSLSAAFENVGYAGTGTFNQNGGTNTISGDLRIGNASYAGSSGTYNLNAGTLTVGGNIFPYGGGQSIGTLTIGNGTLMVGGGNGIINVGSLVLGSITGSNVNYALTNTGLYQDANKVAGTLTAGNITVGRDGTATFAQNGSNMVTGTITIAANTGSSGTYNLNGGLLNALNIVVNSGGSFNFNGGTLAVGTFSGNLANIGGTLMPGGGAPGTTNILGNYSQSGGGILAVTLAGTGLGQFSAVHVSGTATLSGTLDISLFGSGLFGPGYTPQFGDTFDILSAASLSGQFTALTYAPLSNGLVWDVSYITDGNGSVVSLRAVPIPAAIWLFGSGLVGLLHFSRRRRR